MSPSPVRFDISAVPSPCFVIDTALLERNLKILDTVQGRTGCKILLALKGFAPFALFPLIRSYLCGVSAASPDEARLGYEDFGGEVHVCAPAYREEDLDDILYWADHLVFNSFSQWHRFRARVRSAPTPVSCGIRVNPEHSEAPAAIYDPCAPGSRLGVTRKHFEPDALDGIDGLHFHTLCEQNVDALERTLAAFSERFGEWVDRMAWVNFGGGHHITRPDYDLDRLCDLLDGFADRHPVTIYLEPGEAVGLNTGVLVATVLDVVRNGMDIAILDTSAAAHMPDVLDMPYRPEILGAGRPGQYPHTYRLGGLTCLAGDIIGDYSFRHPLRVGDRLAFLDMAHYTMVKTTTFNGVRLPAIAAVDADGGIQTVRAFGYGDFKGRLS